MLLLYWNEPNPTWPWIRHCVCGYLVICLTSCSWEGIYSTLHQFFCWKQQCCCGSMTHTWSSWIFVMTLGCSLFWLDSSSFSCWFSVDFISNKDGTYDVPYDFLIFLLRQWLCNRWPYDVLNQGPTTSSLSAASVFPSLHSILQQNTMQRVSSRPTSLSLS